jgi:hypothetical protein
MPTPRKRLGKGLAPSWASKPWKPPAPGGVTEVAVSRIRPNRFQPRHTFEPEAIADLAASIAQKGVLQPLIVTSAPDGGWELVSGERRWRAAQQVGLATVPVIVREVDERDLLEIALIENLQRGGPGRDRGGLRLPAADRRLPVRPRPSSPSTWGGAGPRSRTHFGSSTSRTRSRRRSGRGRSPRGTGARSWASRAGAASELARGRPSAGCPCASWSAA